MAKKTLQDPRKTRGEDLKTFETGVTQMYAKKWAAAAKAFQAVSESQRGNPLGERARRYLSVCESKTSTPADEGDNFLAAVVAKNDGDLDAAMDLCTRGGLKGRDERFAYLAAAIEGLRENLGEAARLLEAAIGMNPENRVHAYHDPDFAGLRDHPDHGSLFSV